MDDTTRAIVQKVIVRYKAPTKIFSGHTVSLFFDCARLSPSDLARLAAEATGDLPEHSFDMVIGIAYSGVLFSAAVAGGREVGILQADGKLYGPPVVGKKILVVDDVISGGARVRQSAEIVTRAGGAVVGCACIVDRPGGRERELPFAIWSAVQSPLDATAQDPLV